MNKTVFFITGQDVLWEAYNDEKTLEKGVFNIGLNKNGQILDFIADIIKKFEAKKICISVNAVFNSETGDLTLNPKIKSKNFNLYEALRKRVGTDDFQIKLLTNPDATLLGEATEYKSENAIQIEFGLQKINGAVLSKGKLLVNPHGHFSKYGTFPIPDKDDKFIKAVDRLSISSFLKRINNKYANIDELFSNFKIYDKEITAWISEMAIFVFALYTYFHSDKVFILGDLTKHKKFEEILLYNINNIGNIFSKFVKKTETIFLSNNKKSGIAGCKVCLK